MLPLTSNAPWIGILLSLRWGFQESGSGKNPHGDIWDPESYPVWIQGHLMGLESGCLLGAGFSAKSMAS